MGKIKKTIQNTLINAAHKKYRREYEEAFDGFNRYTASERAALSKHFESSRCNLIGAFISWGELYDFAKNFGEDKCVGVDFYIFTGDNGVCPDYTEAAFGEFFEANPDAVTACADEDVYACLEPGNVKSEKDIVFADCSDTFLKPVSSPETFVSYRYYGNISAIRTSAIKEVGFDVDCIISGNENLSGKRMLYKLEMEIFNRYGAKSSGHLPMILYHAVVDKDKPHDDFYWGGGKEYEDLKTEYISKPTNEKVSVVIPSKDNPTVLEKCISSMREKTSYPNYEIILVDNGSSEENKALITEMSEKYGFKYIYEKLDFNFSHMCNTGVNVAEGEYVLLLNDDMEITSEDWMSKLEATASDREIGAVGAKLFYPDSDIIQHVGITNAVDGPVHKFIGKSDSVDYYHGRNRYNRNMLGVTGACLMVKKALYQKLGGLDENLRVAYNDVDFCFSLWEEGYRNVLRNDVTLFHHESLSRGGDSQSLEKMERLKKEREYLYSKHPSLFRNDPYEGAFVSGGSQVSFVEDNLDMVEPKATGKDYASFPSGIHVSIDRAGKMYGNDDKKLYGVEGFLVIPEADNARYSFTMILVKDGTYYSIPLAKTIRKDISEGFTGATNTDLAGFRVVFDGEVLPEGEYEIGFFAADSCSRQRLFNNTSQTLEIN